MRRLQQAAESTQPGCWPEIVQRGLHPLVSASFSFRPRPTETTRARLRNPGSLAEPLFLLSLVERNGTRATKINKLRTRCLGRRLESWLFPSRMWHPSASLIISDRGNRRWPVGERARGIRALVAAGVSIRPRRVTPTIFQLSRSASLRSAGKTLRARREGKEGKEGRGGREGKE